jgi:hypothetical protein
MNGDDEFTYPDEINIFPVYQTLTHYPGVGGTPLLCDQFDNTLNVIGPGVQEVRTVVVDFTCSTAGNLVEPGYFVYQNQVTDRAGNTATLGTTSYAVDDVSLGGAAPVWALFQFVNGFYNPGEKAGFEIFATDDLEVIDADIGLVHPIQGGSLLVHYGYGQIDAFARFDGFDPMDVDPWDLFDATLFSAAATGEIHETPLNVFGRFDFTCLGGAPYASCIEDDGVALDDTEYNLVLDDDTSMLPTDATAWLKDVGHNETPLGANITFIPAQWESSTPAPWSELAPGTDPADNEVIIRRFYVTEVTAGSAYDAVMEAPTSIEVPFFENVALVNNVAGEIYICGIMDFIDDTDNGVDRFFNYSFSIPTGSLCDGLAGTWHAVGIKEDAALVTQGI